MSDLKLQRKGVDLQRRLPQTEQFNLEIRGGLSYKKAKIKQRKMWIALGLGIEPYTDKNE